MTGRTPLLSLCEADGRAGCALAPREIALRGRGHNLLEPITAHGFDSIGRHRHLVDCFEPQRFDRAAGTGALNA